MTPPSARLVLVRGKAKPPSLALPAQGEVRLGRDPEATVQLEGDRVSRQHARLVFEDGAWVVEDLASTVGTRVGGSPIRRHVLSPGDEIALGDVTLRFESAGGGMGPASAGPPAGPQPRLLQALAVLLADDSRGAGELLGPMLDDLLPAFGADRGIVFAPGPGEGFSVAARRVRPGAEGGPDDPVSQKLVARVASGKEPLLVTSAETMELRKEFESIAGTLRSILAAPLPVGEATGVLYLDSVFERRRFEEADRELLLAFGAAAGRVLARDREKRQVERRSERMAELLRRGVGGEILGRSPALASVMDEVARAAPADVTVLVTGESGTGKELVARALHKASPRAPQAFVAVNCAAIPPELVESELFGHEKGAFSGADARRLGQFELADGGTLFLDEVGELPLPVQGKLLRALQERTIVRVGSGKPVPVDFRLVAATHVDLGGAVKAGKFREDLFYRIAVFRIRLPALRERGDDVVVLAEAFLARFAKELRRPVAKLGREAAAALKAHAWPGNVRELRNVIEQAVVREDGAELSLAAVAPALGLEGQAERPAARGAGPPPGGGDSIGAFPPTYEAAKTEFERRYLLHHIQAHGANMKATAEALQLSRRYLYKKCDELGIDYSGFRGD